MLLYNVTWLTVYMNASFVLRLEVAGLKRRFGSIPRAFFPLAIDWNIARQKRRRLKSGTDGGNRGQTERSQISRHEKSKRPVCPQFPRADDRVRSSEQTRLVLGFRQLGMGNLD